jgi:hypothetical protein
VTTVAQSRAVDSHAGRGFRLTSRDMAIIRAVYEYRALTTDLLEVLFFPRLTQWSRERANPLCQRRLQFLHRAGYLARDEQLQKRSEGRRPYIYTLAAAGARRLAEHLDIGVDELDWDPKAPLVSPQGFAHLLTTNAVRVSIARAAQQAGFTIERWVDDKALHSRQMKESVELTGPQGAVSKAAVIPDGFFHLSWTLPHARRHFHHFLEVDLGTVTGAASGSGRRDFHRKILAYLAFWRSGRFTARYGAKAFRVLTATTSPRRREHLRALTEAAGGGRIFWFTTLEQLRDPTINCLTHPIWSVAKPTHDGLYPLLEEPGK